MSCCRCCPSNGAKCINKTEIYHDIPMIPAPCTTPIATRIKVQSDLNQHPQWLLIPKGARSVQDLVKSLVVRLELPDSAYDLCLDGAPILPNEDVALVRDGEHLYLRQRQPPSPQPPQLKEPHEPQRLSVSSEPDDVRYETHRKRKRVLTPDGKRRRNARNRKREKRRRLERRESPNKPDPSIFNLQHDDPNIAQDARVPHTGNGTTLPDSSFRNEPRESPDKRDPSILDSQHDDPNMAEDTVTPHIGNGTALPDSASRNESRESPDKRDSSIPNFQHEDPNVMGDTVARHTSKDPAGPDSSSRNEPQNISANVTAPCHVATPYLLSLDCEKALVHPPALPLPFERTEPERRERKQSKPPDDQNRCVLVTAAERTSSPQPPTCDQLSNLKSGGQMKSLESHGKAAVLKETASKNAALRDKDVRAQNVKHHADIISSAEALQPKVNNSESTKNGEVTVNISFVNEVVDVVNEDTFIANSAVDIESKFVQQGHSQSDNGQKQIQSLHEIERASVSQMDRRDILKSVKPRWKRQRLQSNDRTREQPDPQSTSVAGTENEESHRADASVTNDASDGLETQGNPGHGTDARRAQDERAETTRPPLDVINLVDLEEDCAHASDHPQGPHQSVSANSSKSNSPQSIVVSPAEPRNAILAKRGFSTLHALQVARKAGLLSAEKQKGDIESKPETATEEGGKVRKKGKRRKRSKSSMRYLTEEQINKSTFIGHRSETLLPPLELLDLPEGADELRQAVDVPETLLKTSKRSPPETPSRGQEETEVTSEPHDKTEGTSLVATAATSAVSLSGNRSESARQEKKQSAQEPNSRLGLKINQSETQASEQQRHGMRRESVAHNPPESQRTSTLNNVSPTLGTGDNFREDLVLMLRHTTKTLAEVWAKCDDCQ